MVNKENAWLWMCGISVSWTRVECKCFRSQRHSEQAALQSLCLMCLVLIKSHIPSLRLLCSFVQFQFFTISSTPGLSSQLSHTEVWPFSISFQQESPFPPTLSHRATGKQLHTENKLRQTLIHHRNQWPKLKNNPMMVGWGEGAPATLAQTKYQLSDKAF